MHYGPLASHALSHTLARRVEGHASRTLHHRDARVLIEQFINISSVERSPSPASSFIDYKTAKSMLA